jgi:hypothetical protein
VCVNNVQFGAMQLVVTKAFELKNTKPDLLSKAVLASKHMLLSESLS